MQKQDHIDELRRQNQQIQANLEHYRNASLEQRIADQERYEQQQNQLETTIQQISHKLTKVQHEKSVSQQENQRLTFENDNLKTQLDKLNVQHESISTRLTDALNELAKKTQDQQHWQAQLQTLQVKWDEQNKSFLELQTKHAISSRQLETVTAEIKEIRDQNKVLAHEKWVLGQEKAQLYGQLKQLESN
jgi:chromosome segregation ATPase